MIITLEATTGKLEIMHFKIDDMAIYEVCSQLASLYAIHGAPKCRIDVYIYMHNYISNFKFQYATSVWLAISLITVLFQRCTCCIHCCYFSIHNHGNNI